MRNFDINFTLAQLNFTVGDIFNNADKIINACHDAKKFQEADMVIFPELALSGYPPEDLLYHQNFYQQIQIALKKIQKNLPAQLCAIIGYPETDLTQYQTFKKHNSAQKILSYNSAIVMTRNKIIANYRKQILPNYGVFDEKRYFTAGTQSCVFSYKNHKIGLAICEDAWYPQPLQDKKNSGAEIIIVINASPFDEYKIQTRWNVIKKRCREINLPIIYVNHCCGHDDLIFDGSAFVLNHKAEMVLHAPFAKETLIAFNPIQKNKRLQFQLRKNHWAHIYHALVLGIRDYVTKNHFKKVILGFSGGIDSSLVLAIAADAIGKENVLPVMLPSRFTSRISIATAKQQLKNMEMNYQEISIEPMFEQTLSSLDLDIQKIDLTIQNIQARIRAVILMALANSTHRLLLNTSNKSELAVGYSTIYGDMCGAYAVIKDVWKTHVYQLARYRNQISPIIPKKIISRPPTAELAHEQLDTDLLPPYPLLDKILKRYIEQEQDIEEMIRAGFDKNIVTRIVKLIVMNEYKRKQSPLGPRISSLAFTRERRYPITSGFY